MHINECRPVHSERVPTSARLRQQQAAAQLPKQQAAAQHRRQTQRSKSSPPMYRCRQG